MPRGAAIFNGTTSSGIYDPASTIISTLPITICAWFKRGALATVTFGQVATASVNSSVALRQMSDAFATLRNNSTAAFGVTTTAATWQSVVGVFTATDQKLYLNGVLDATESTAIGAANYTNLSVGGQYHLGAFIAFCNCRMAHFSVHLAQFTATHALNHAAGVPANILPSPFAWYKLEANGLDSIGTRHMTLANVTFDVTDGPPVVSTSDQASSIGQRIGRSVGRGPYDIDRPHGRRRR